MPENLIFAARRLDPVEELESNIDQNPYYPFTRTLDDKLVYRVRYNTYWMGIVGCVANAIIVITMISTGNWDSNYFLGPILLFMLSVFSVTTYGDSRTYIIDPAEGNYTFMLGDRVVIVDRLNNIYVRLRKRIDAGGTYYYIILHGYRIDKQMLSRASPKLREMRALGQRLAANVDLNYFDESNISQFRESEPHAQSIA